MNGENSNIGRRSHNLESVSTSQFENAKAEVTAKKEAYLSRAEQVKAQLNDNLSSIQTTIKASGDEIKASVEKPTSAQKKALAGIGSREDKLLHLSKKSAQQLKSLGHQVSDDTKHFKKNVDNKITKLSGNVEGLKNAQGERIRKTQQKEEKYNEKVANLSQVKKFRIRKLANWRISRSEKSFSKTFEKTKKKGEASQEKVVGKAQTVEAKLAKVEKRETAFEERRMEIDHSMQELNKDAADFRNAGQKQVAFLGDLNRLKIDLAEQRKHCSAFIQSYPSQKKEVKEQLKELKNMQKEVENLEKEWKKDSKLEQLIQDEKSLSNEDRRVGKQETPMMGEAKAKYEELLDKYRGKGSGVEPSILTKIERSFVPSNHNPVRGWWIFKKSNPTYTTKVPTPMGFSPGSSMPTPSLLSTEKTQAPPSAHPEMASSQQRPMGSLRGQPANLPPPPPLTPPPTGAPTPPSAPSAPAAPTSAPAAPAASRQNTATPTPNRRPLPQPSRQGPGPAPTPLATPPPLSREPLPIDAGGGLSDSKPVIKQAAPTAANISSGGEVVTIVSTELENTSKKMQELGKLFEMDGGFAKQLNAKDEKVFNEFAGLMKDHSRDCDNLRREFEAALMKAGSDKEKGEAVEKLFSDRNPTFVQYRNSLVEIEKKQSEMKVLIKDNNAAFEAWRDKLNKQDFPELAKANIVPATIRNFSELSRVSAMKLVKSFETAKMEGPKKAFDQLTMSRSSTLFNDSLQEIDTVLKGTVPQMQQMVEYFEIGKGIATKFKGDEKAFFSEYLDLMKAHQRDCEVLSAKFSETFKDVTSDKEKGEKLAKFFSNDNAAFVKYNESLLRIGPRQIQFQQIVKDNQKVFANWAKANSNEFMQKNTGKQIYAVPASIPNNFSQLAMQRNQKYTLLFRSGLTENYEKLTGNNPFAGSLEIMDTVAAGLNRAADKSNVHANVDLLLSQRFVPESDIPKFAFMLEKAKDLKSNDGDFVLNNEDRRKFETCLSAMQNFQVKDNDINIKLQKINKIKNPNTKAVELAKLMNTNEYKEYINAIETLGNSSKEIAQFLSNKSNLNSIADIYKENPEKAINPGTFAEFFKDAPNKAARVLEKITSFADLALQDKKIKHASLFTGVQSDYQRRLDEYKGKSQRKSI